MTDKTRADFEAWAAHQEMDMNRFDIGYSDCNTDYAWLAWQAATLKATLAERERCAAICEAQAAAGKKARNMQYIVGCNECLDAITATPQGKI